MLDSEYAMYLIGGHGYYGKINSVYRLDVRSCRWHHIAEPEPQQNFSPRDKFAAWDYQDKFVNSRLFKHTVLKSEVWCVQCSDAVGWASGITSGLYKLSDDMLVWLSVWSKV